MNNPKNMENFDAWLGRTQTTSDILTPRLLTSWRASLDFDGLDMSGSTSGVQWCLAPGLPVNQDLGEDGHPKRGGFFPPIAMPRRMWAGSAFDVFDTLQEGDEVDHASEIIDIERKEGRSGALWFVKVKHAWKTLRGPAVVETQDIVYRAPPSPTTGSQANENPVVPYETGKYTLGVSVSTAELFRYSAVTFNTHKIHYDYPYATQIEGYTGLVVHGPLQATLLLNFARQIHGQSPTQFSFRAVSPLIAGASFALNADEDRYGLNLWVADQRGGKALSAKAIWA